MTVVSDATNSANKWLFIEGIHELLLGIFDYFNEEFIRLSLNPMLIGGSVFGCDTAWDLVLYC